jgi:hypothetical protein
VELCHDQTDPDGTQVANDKPAGRLELIEIRHPSLIKRLITFTRAIVADEALQGTCVTGIY